MKSKLSMHFAEGEVCRKIRIFGKDLPQALRSAADYIKKEKDKYPFFQVIELTLREGCVCLIVIDQEIYKAVDSYREKFISDQKLCELKGCMNSNQKKAAGNITSITGQAAVYACEDCLSHILYKAKVE